MKTLFALKISAAEAVILRLAASAPLRVNGKSFRALRSRTICRAAVLRMITDGLLQHAGNGRRVEISAEGRDAMIGRRGLFNLRLPIIGPLPPPLPVVGEAC